jgi:hypothetical protein
LKGINIKIVRSGQWRVGSKTKTTKKSGLAGRRDTAWGHTPIKYVIKDG